MKKYLIILLLIPSLCLAKIHEECIVHGWVVWKTETGYILEGLNKAVFILGHEEKFCNGVKKIIEATE